MSFVLNGLFCCASGNEPILKPLRKKTNQYKHCSGHVFNWQHYFF